MNDKEPYIATEKISEVEATLAMEGMKLDDSDIQLLQAIKSGKFSTDQARARILSEV